MRILALDVGEKSCGIARSDMLKIIAQPIENFMFPNRNWNILIDHLKSEYLKDIEKIVIGLPLLPSGDDSKTTKMIRKFKDLLALETEIPIVFEEEFGTTNEAHEIMISADVSRKKRKQHKDKLAAAIILKRFLERM